MNVERLFYIWFVTGVILWQMDTFYYYYSVVKSRLFLNRNLKDVTDGLGPKNYAPYEKKLKWMIESVGGEKYFSEPEHFIMASGLIGLLAFVLGYMVSGVSMAAFAFSISIFVPYAVLLVMVHNRQVANSLEGDMLVQELLNNYKIYHCNIKDAIEVSAVQMTSRPNSRRLLLNLAKGMNSAVTREEVREVIDSFKYAINTSWGNVLATNIYFAHTEGMLIDSAMEDLAQTMSKSREVIEHGKRENNEARLIIKYLTPGAFMLSVVGACRFFGFTLSKYLKYQFGTALGIKWFFIMASCYILALVVNSYLSKEKMDI